MKSDNLNEFIKAMEAGMFEAWLKKETALFYARVLVTAKTHFGLTLEDGEQIATTFDNKNKSQSTIKIFS